MMKRGLVVGIGGFIYFLFVLSVLLKALDTITPATALLFLMSSLLLALPLGQAMSLVVEKE